MVDTKGLDEEIRCAMCRNQMKTDRGCDGNCQVDENLCKEIIQIIEKYLPPVQPEITQVQLKEYCKKRCLTVITDDLFYKLTSDSENTATWESCGEFWEHRSGLEKFKCNCCGGEVILYFGAKYPNFCPYCGRKSIADTGYERKIEDNGYGFMLITGRRKDED